VEIGVQSGGPAETKPLFETSIKTPRMIKDQFDEILKENPRVDRKKLKVTIDGKPIIEYYLFAC
jgi:hypothetical protein